MIPEVLPTDVRSAARSTPAEDISVRGVREPGGGRIQREHQTTLPAVPDGVQVRALPKGYRDGPHGRSSLWSWRVGVCAQLAVSRGGRVEATAGER